MTLADQCIRILTMRGNHIDTLLSCCSSSAGCSQYMYQCASGVVNEPVSLLFYIPSFLPSPFALPILFFGPFQLSSPSFLPIHSMDPTTQVNPFASFPIEPNLGALEIGFLCSGFFFGVLTVQVLIYNRKFSKDPLSIKLLVVAIWVFELAELGCIAHAAYRLTINESGNVLAILSPPKTIGASFFFGSAVGPLVEAFYVSRLLRFSGKIYPALLGWLLAFARFGGWVFLSAHVIVMESVAQFVHDFGWLFAALLGMSAVVDLVISAWIAYFLACRRSQSAAQGEGESARQLLNRVILWTLQTGVITSLSFLGTLICYLLLGQYMIWLAVLAILTKVSSNCFLASLNARASPRARGIRSGNSSGPGRRPSARWAQTTASLHINPASTQSIGNIIELYQGSDDADHDDQMHNGRSAFSPDGTPTVLSRRSSRNSGYWAL
ncbi:hypothetical protein FB45DRAFT_518619 [Roridomyces roridus]|uniref:DUF6534 domain-containing protein n=1 Tax=Roridomyces roridus TaxID=1738132 RepID=A0AAD7BXB2_9AGAR|nr:hypothetical protein FB45DRAFT_518619 [Roridomyces roridus]